MRSLSKTPRRANTWRLLALLVTAVLLVLPGCRKDNEMADMRNASELYQDAKKSLDNKSWDRAIHSYKRLQTRYPVLRTLRRTMCAPINDYQVVNHTLFVYASSCAG